MIYAVETAERSAASILESIVRDGYKSGSEPYEICSWALSQIGLPYLRTEELASNTIDCSTLTSQAHWIGAAIGIPFIADGQRTGASGMHIDSVKDSRPGDIWVRYPNAAASPDSQFNHVGIYLGDQNAGGLIVEAKGGSGVILTPAKEFSAGGGIKRYSLSNEPFDENTTRQVRNLCMCVPKFGRLGVRNYVKRSNLRVMHRGVDLYIPAGSAVVSPCEGIIFRDWDETEQCAGVRIVSGQSGLSVRFMHLMSHLDEGTQVNRGDLIGHVTPPSSASLLQYAYPDDQDNSHIHFEIEGARTEIGGLKASVIVDNKHFFNGLYLAKRGYIGLPLKKTSKS